MQPMLTSHTGGQEVHLRVLVDVTSDGGPLPGLLMAAFWFSPQLAEREREGTSSLVTSIRVWILSWAPPL